MSAERPTNPIDLTAAPTDSAYWLMHSAIARVEGLPEARSRGRAVKVFYLGEDYGVPEPEGETQGLHLQIGQQARVRGDREVVNLSSSIRIMAGIGPTEYVFDAFFEDQALETRQAIAQVVGRLSCYMPDAQGDWLLDLWAEAQRCPPALADVSTERLLNTSPTPVQQYASATIDAVFNNGATLQGNWIYGNEPFWDDRSAGVIQQGLHLVAPEGTMYEYARRIHGAETLDVTPPAARNFSTFLSSIRAFRASQEAARQRERSVGVSHLTHGNVVAFSAELANAFTSGQKSPNQS